MHQTDAILEYLQSGKPLSSLEAFKLFGCSRLAAQIWNLKRRGYDIESTIITVPTRYGKDARVAQYTLMQEAAE